MRPGRHSKCMSGGSQLPDDAALSQPHCSELDSCARSGRQLNVPGDTVCVSSTTTHQCWSQQHCAYAWCMEVRRSPWTSGAGHASLGRSTPAATRTAQSTARKRSSTRSCSTDTGSENPGSSESTVVVPEWPSRDLQRQPGAGASSQHKQRSTQYRKQAGRVADTSLQQGTQPLRSGPLLSGPDHVLEAIPASTAPLTEGACRASAGHSLIHQRPVHEASDVIPILHGLLDLQARSQGTLRGNMHSRPGQQVPYTHREPGFRALVSICA